MRNLLAATLLACMLAPSAYAQDRPVWPADWPRQWIPQATPSQEECKRLIGVVYDALLVNEMVHIDDPREGVVLHGVGGKPFLGEDGRKQKSVKKWNPFIPRLSMRAIGTLMSFSNACAYELLYDVNSGPGLFVRNSYSFDEMFMMYQANNILADLTVETSLRTLEYGQKVKEYREKILLIARGALAGCYARSAIPPPRTDPMDEILGMSTKEFERLLMFGTILENLRPHQY